MKALKQFKQSCETNGFRKGESAADFRKRDPQAAMRVAEFLRANMREVVREFTDVMQKCAS